MKKINYCILVFLGLGFSSLQAAALGHEDSIRLNKISYEAVVSSAQEFTKVSVENFDQDRTVGSPQLPIKTYLLIGKPEEITVDVSILETATVKNIKPWPVQPEDCRCETKKKKEFAYNQVAYAEAKPKFTLTYLGAFRGQAVTRLDVQLAHYKNESNSVDFHTDVKVSFDVKPFQFTSGSYTDYLIVMPAKASYDFSAFKQWKEARGYKVNILKLGANETTTASIQAKIKESYLAHGIDFVILVGDESALPMFYVNTSGSPKTPSDLQYFTMDGASDDIPDVFYSRLSSADPVGQLQNAMDFEAGRGAAGGYQRVVGIASNEGAKPSDNEYISSIENKFTSVMGSQVVHLFQDNKDSNPDNLNNQLNTGAFWLTYMGHGSGVSWPSLNSIYKTSHVPLLNNKESVRPIIIDVACQNGRLQAGRLGLSFSTPKINGQQNAYGSAAYYGGSVDIAWHPPAIMAQGIAFEHLDKHYKHLGEALFAGQIYLSTHWNDKDAFVDNMEWYHLQGDPGMDISF